MKISISADYVRKMRGTKELRGYADTLQICKEAGFEALDIFPDVFGSDWEQSTEKIIKAAGEYGLELHQGHMPMNRYAQKPADEFRAFKMRSVDAAAKMGLSYLVMHADEYLPTEEYDPVAAQRQIYDDLAPVVEYAKTKNVGLAIENVFEDGFRAPYPGCRTRYTSEIEELLSLIDRFNDPAVTCCWDFGHAQVQFKDDAMDMMKKAGKRITCTHVHDNYYNKDLHLPPFLGRADWETAVRWLTSSGYKGNFSFEFVYGSVPEELLPAYLKLACDTGKWMLKEYAR